MYSTTRQGACPSLFHPPCHPGFPPNHAVAFQLCCVNVSSQPRRWFECGGVQALGVHCSARLCSLRLSQCTQPPAGGPTLRLTLTPACSATALSARTRAGPPRRLLREAHAQAGRRHGLSSSGSVAVWQAGSASAVPVQGA